MKLSKILAEKKDKNLYSISADASLKSAAEQMSCRRIGALLVTDPADQAKYVGIICDHDIIAAFCKEDKIDGSQVRDAMTSRMIVATVEDRVDYIMTVMIRHKISHVPVIEKAKITGLISMSDIIKALHTDDEIKIRYYGDYLSGTHGSNVF